MRFLIVKIKKKNEKKLETYGWRENAATNVCGVPAGCNSICLRNAPVNNTFFSNHRKCYDKKHTHTHTEVL